MNHFGPYWCVIYAAAFAFVVWYKYPRSAKRVTVATIAANRAAVTPSTTPAPSSETKVSWGWVGPVVGPVVGLVVIVALIAAVWRWAPGFVQASTPQQAAIADDVPIISSSPDRCEGSGTLVLKAHADSRPFYTPGCYITFTGTDYTERCFYEDNTIGIVGDQENPCHKGPMRKQQIHNDVDDTNYVSYAIHS